MVHMHERQVETHSHGRVTALWTLLSSVIIHSKGALAVWMIQSITSVHNVGDIMLFDLVIIK